MFEVHDPKKHGSVTWFIENALCVIKAYMPEKYEGRSAEWLSEKLNTNKVFAMRFLHGDVSMVSLFMAQKIVDLCNDLGVDVLISTLLTRDPAEFKPQDYKK